MTLSSTLSEHLSDEKAAYSVERRQTEKSEFDEESSASNDADSEKSDGRPWNPKLLQFGTLSGNCAMMLALACLLASLGILAGSNHQAVSTWHAPPATYLAISTAIANLAMRYAALQGVVIAWWLRAIRGSTLAQLHSDWRSGSSFRDDLPGL